MNRLKKIAKILWLTGTTVLSVLTVVSANGGLVDPCIWIIPSFLAMAFPMFILANCAAGIVNLFVSRKAAVVQLAALLLSVSGLVSYCPVNYPRPDEASFPPERLLRCMTYNTHGFDDPEQIYPDSTNRTVTQFINSGADLIALQEVYLIQPNAINHVTQAQVDSINSIYPYRISDNEFIYFLSKYPLQKIEVPQPQSTYASWGMAETEIGGMRLLVVCIHLQSLGLTDDDKQGYMNITNGQDEANWKSDTKSLYRKLADAFILRANQANMLAAQLDSLAYDNVLLCGDFNDIAGCYAMRRLRRVGMKDAYAEAGTGPLITYNANRFYFHIDQILYRGALRPLSISRGRIPSSDHYPLHCTFLIDNQQ